MKDRKIVAIQSGSGDDGDEIMVSHIDVAADLDMKFAAAQWESQREKKWQDDAFSFRKWLIENNLGVEPSEGFEYFACDGIHR